MLLLQEKDEGIFFNQKLIFFRLKKDEWLIFQSRKDFISFNKLSLYRIKKNQLNGQYQYQLRPPKPIWENGRPKSPNRSSPVIVKLVLLGWVRVAELGRAVLKFWIPHVVCFYTEHLLFFMTYLNFWVTYVTQMPTQVNLAHPTSWASTRGFESVVRTRGLLDNFWPFFIEFSMM